MNQTIDQKSFKSLLESETLLRAIIENAIDGIITINHQGIIETVNPAAAKLFGYDEKELFGQNINMLMPEPYHSRHDSYISNYNRTGEKKIIGIGREVSGLRKDGNTFPFWLSISEVTLENRKIFAGIIHDVSEQKKAEEELRKYTSELEEKVQERTSELLDVVINLEKTNFQLEEQIKERKTVEQALRESQELYVAIARNFPNGTISVLDEDLKYVFIEGKELFKLGVTSEMLIGTRITERLKPEIARKVEPVLHEVFRGESRTFELGHKGNYYLLIAVPLGATNEKTRQILIVEENITEQKHAEEEINKALKKEKELNELKSRFVSMASHEFRTPLSTILTSVSLIDKYRDVSDIDKRNKHIQRIKSSVHNLTGILNDFLSLDKLEEGKLYVNLQPFEITSFAFEITEEMQTVTKAGQKINYQHLGETTPVILDKLLLKNIIINLLSNAIKYSPENKPIEFKTINETGSLIIIVRDYGIGIPEEDRQYMFDRFFRARNVTNIQGTGLGLNIVKKYLDLLGGAVNFISHGHEGTEFIITLPHPTNNKNQHA